MPNANYCFATTHIGHVRSANEDSIALSSTGQVPLVSWQGALPRKSSWALVADGMGGHAAGGLASRLAIELLRPVIGGLETAQEIGIALNAVNQAFFDTMSSHPEVVGFGTTIAGAIFRGDQALLFNVGDSRIYRLADERLTQLSRDDVISSHMLTQCLGGLSKVARIRPHVVETPLDHGDRLLLCSDGLTGMIADEHIAEILRSTNADPAHALVLAALDAGGSDNVSAIVMDIARL